MVLATRSAGKLKEMRPLLEAAGFEPLDLATLGIEETPMEAGIECFDTFEENAIAKARYFGSLAGLPAIADDSGLEVDALAGRPGVHSKRWAHRDDLEGQALDDANNELLLRELGHNPDRTARYRCAAAYVDGDREIVAMGSTEGRIVDEPRGDQGFGYDPHFESAELGRTFGECDVPTKEAISHRGRAMRALLTLMSKEVDADVERG